MAPATVATGDVYLANLEPVVGSEQGRTRPVVVFQAPNLARFTSTTLIVPLTTNMNRLGVPGTCVLVAGDGGLTQDSVALGFQLRAVDGQRLKKRLGHLSQESITAIAEAILVALGISLPGAPKLRSPRH